eukprot:scaffold96549_cov60-Phaeocystis_antarctica.AAC.7
MPVLADTTATAILALAAPPPVFAEASAAALLASAAHPPMLADAAAVALLACVARIRCGRRRRTPRAGHSLDDSKGRRVCAIMVGAYGRARYGGKLAEQGQKTAERFATQHWHSRVTTRWPGSPLGTYRARARRR